MHFAQVRMAHGTYCGEGLRKLFTARPHTLRFAGADFILLLTALAICPAGDARHDDSKSTLKLLKVIG